MGQFFIDLEGDYTDRFDMGRFMAYTDNSDPLTSAFIDAIPGLPQTGEYLVQGEDGRPDLLSYRIYGDPQFWWILLAFNKKIDYTDITTGEVIRYPSIDSLETVYFSLKAKETSAV